MASILDKLKSANAASAQTAAIPMTAPIPAQVLQQTKEQPLDEKSLADVQLDDFNFANQPTTLPLATQEELANALTILEQSLHDKDAVASILATVLKQIKASPMFMDFLKEDDLVLLVRAHRVARSVIMKKKQATATKRTQGRQEVQDIINIFGGVKLEV